MRFCLGFGKCSPEYRMYAVVACPCLLEFVFAREPRNGQRKKGARIACSLFLSKLWCDGTASEGQPAVNFFAPARIGRILSRFWRGAIRKTRPLEKARLCRWTKSLMIPCPGNGAGKGPSGEKTGYRPRAKIVFRCRKKLAPRGGQGRVAVRPSFLRSARRSCCQWLFFLRP